MSNREQARDGIRMGITSDTHGDVEAWAEVAKLFGRVDLVVHAGDVLYYGTRNPLLTGCRPPALATVLQELPCPLLISMGNCDAASDATYLQVPWQSPVLFLQYEGLRLLAHHGHQYNQDELLNMARRWGVHVCITGHTHIPNLERRNNVILLNPGSPSLPKGTFPRPTAALIAGGAVRLFDVTTGEMLGEERL